MFADRFGQQATLEAYGDDEARTDLVQAAAAERKDRAELLATTGLTVGNLEKLVLGDAVIGIQEWLDFSPETQEELLDSRLSRLESELTDRLEDTEPADGAADTGAFGFDHDHVEIDGRWGYD